MIDRADTNQDGEIDPEEFYAIMTKRTFGVRGRADRPVARRRLTAPCHARCAPPQ